MHLGSPTRGRHPLSRLTTTAALGLLVGCGGGSGEPPVVVDGAFVTGHVEALGSGATLTGVSIRLGTHTATTNEQGWYVLDEIATPDEGVVSGTLDGYLPAFERVSLVGGAAYHVDLFMVPAGGTQTVSASDGGTVSVAGATITVPPGAFVDATGSAVSGDVTLTVATVDPGASDAAMDGFPGDFVGVGSDGEEGPLESFGIFAIEARQGTALLQLADGRALDVRVPIAASGLATAPATVPLWSLDEGSGLWMEEGTATRDANDYLASVPHLSWWNFDAIYIDRTTCVEVCYEDDTGARVRGVFVRIRMPEGRASVSGYTGTDGCIALNLRASTSAVLEASYNGTDASPRSFTTQSVITNTRRTPPNCQDLGVLNISPPAAQVVLTWGPEPSDLDAHMTGPASAGRFHTYYAARGSETEEPYCALDTDDTSSYGPEVITLHRPMSGVFRYSVHNFSGQDAYPIEASGARAVLMVPGLGQILAFTPPASNGGNRNVWRVFDLEAEGSRIVGVTSINDFAETSSSDGPAFHP